MKKQLVGSLDLNTTSNEQEETKDLHPQKSENITKVEVHRNHQQDEEFKGSLPENHDYRN